MNQVVDVIVIGAGLAGLTAAYKILDKEPSLNVLVLEASDRTGGRYFTVPLLVQDGAATSQFDLSANWIHNEQTQLLNLLRELNIQAVKSCVDGEVILDYRGRKFVNSRHSLLYFLSIPDKFQLTVFILKIESLCRDFREKSDTKKLLDLADVSLRAFINCNVSSVPAQLIIEYMILINCGVRTYDISLLFYIFYCVSNKGIVNQILTDVPENYRMRMKNARQSICDKLAERIGHNYILNHQRVLEIVSKEYYVTIKTEHSQYRCSNVVMAIPPNELLNITFKPPLMPRKIDLVSNMTSKVVTTFVATYKTDFWREGGFSGEIHVLDNTFSWGPIDFCSDSGHQNPALIGRIFRNQRIANHTAPCYKDEILMQLAEFFGEEALEPTDYYEMSWFQSNCQVACGTFGNVQFLEDMREYFNDRIYWAGSEATNEWYGTIAGAVDSGVKAALEVLYDIRPATLLPDDMAILTPTLNYHRNRPPRHYEDFMYKLVKYGPVYIPVGIIFVLILWKLLT